MLILSTSSIGQHLFSGEGSVMNIKTTDPRIDP